MGCGSVCLFPSILFAFLASSLVWRRLGEVGATIHSLCLYRGVRFVDRGDDLRELEAAIDRALTVYSVCRFVHQPAFLEYE